jgi:hypothetical protein
MKNLVAALFGALFSHHRWAQLAVPPAPWRGAGATVRGFRRHISCPRPLASSLRAGRLFDGTRQDADAAGGSDTGRTHREVGPGAGDDSGGRRSDRPQPATILRA